ncbi:hypothetical protein BSKO_06278 [Bryopsis sp. KO-2023]|nr:hypothetical protein BSKO_06278 [Bryopsis sp. KO-2023]
MVDSLQSRGPGFNFDLAKRNSLLEQNGLKTPQLLKTGTTLAAVVFKDGVVLGADTRSTAGDVIAEKNCQKLRFPAPNLCIAGSGTSADCEHVSSMVASALTLHRHETGRENRTVTAMTMLKTHLRRYQGYVSAALLLGGVDLNGPQLYSIYPHGSVDALPFGTMGSGSYAAISVLEADYKEDLSEEEAKKLVSRSIRAGIMNDAGSGSNVDLVVIKKGELEYLRNYEFLQPKLYTRQNPVHYPKGTTPIVKEKLISLKEIAVVDGDAMDIS